MRTCQEAMLVRAGGRRTGGEEKGARELPMYQYQMTSNLGSDVLSVVISAELPPRASRGFSRTSVESN